MASSDGIPRRPTGKPAVGLGHRSSVSMKIRTSLVFLSTTTLAVHGAFGQGHGMTEKAREVTASAAGASAVAPGAVQETQAPPPPQVPASAHAAAAPSQPPSTESQAPAREPSPSEPQTSVRPPASTTQAEASRIAPAEAEEEDDGSSHQATVDGDGAQSSGTLGRFRMLLQLKYTASHADLAGLDSQARVASEQRATIQAQDGYDVQRAFLRYTAQPIKQVEAKMLLDIAEFRHNSPRQSFKLAYLQIHATKRLQFDVGLMKRTYSLLELLPIADHELADLGPTDSFIKDQGYGGRDIGAIVRYSPLPKRRWLTASVGAFRGDIDEGYDAHPLKLVTARLESYPWKHLRLGVNGAYRPYDNVEMQRLVVDAATGTKDYVEVVTLNSGKAYGADATLLFKRLQVRLEGLYGDRTQSNRVGSDHFAAGWIVIAPNFEVGQVKFVPAAKVERLDLNPAADGGARTVITGVVGVVPLKHLRIIADVTRTVVDSGQLSLNKVPYTSGSHIVYVVEPSSTRGTLQVQYQF